MKKLITALVLSFITLTTSANIETSSEETSKLKVSIKSYINQIYPNTNPQQIDTIAEGLIYNALINQVDVGLMVGIVSVESGFNPKAISKSGAKGLTQVMPVYHRNKIRGRNLFNPSVSLEVGTEIFRDCLLKSRHNHRKALTCYCGYKGESAKQFQQTVLEKSRTFKIVYENTIG